MNGRINQKSFCEQQWLDGSLIGDGMRHSNVINSFVSCALFTARIEHTCELPNGKVKSPSLWLSIHTTTFSGLLMSEQRLLVLEQQ